MSMLGERVCLAWRTLVCVVCIAGGCLLAAGAHAASGTWTNTATGSTLWTTAANWSAATCPGSDGAYQSAYLTNSVGNAYTGVLNTTLSYPIGRLEVRNAAAGGTVCLDVTNAVLTTTGLVIRTGGRLQIDNQGVVSNAATVSSGAWMDGAGAQLVLGSGAGFYVMTNGFSVISTNGGISLGDGAILVLNGAQNVPPLGLGGSGVTNVTLSVPGNGVSISTANYAPVIGNGSAFNKAIFTGTGTVWSLGGQQGRVGGGGPAGSNNMLIVSGGSLSLTNHGTFSMGYGCDRNSMVVTNGGTFLARSRISAGYGGNSNTLIVTGPGTLLDNTGNRCDTGAGGGRFNQIMVGQQGTVSNATFMIGVETTASSSNSLIVTNGGRWYLGSASNSIYYAAIGYFGTNNQGVVTGSGSLLDLGMAMRLSVGYVSASTNGSSRFLIDDHAVVTNGPIAVGNNNLNNGGGTSGNTLILTNGAALFSGGQSMPDYLGWSSSNNTMIVTGPGTVWTHLLSYTDIGYANGAFNTLRIENGAVWTNSGLTAVYVGYTANCNTMVVNNAQAFYNQDFTIGKIGGNSNTLLVANGGRLYGTGIGGFDNTIGYPGQGNAMIVDGAGSLWSLSNRTVFVGYTGGTGNILRVTNGGAVTNVAQLEVGYGSLSNQVLVSGTNSQIASLNNNLFVGGNNSGSTGNVMTVDNGASASGWSTIYVGRLNNMAGNVLVITNGASVQGGGVRVCYQSSNSWNNGIIVASGGLLDAGGSILIDQSGTVLSGNNFVSNSGGIFQFTSGTPTIQTVTGENSSVTLSGGTIAFRGVTGVNVKGNWTGSDLTNIAWTGNNTFRLNNATNATSPDQSYTFATGLGATNYARLELFNGSFYRGGTATIGSGGSLALFGAASTISNLTFNGGRLDVTLNGSNSVATLNAVGNVSLNGGTLNLILAGTPPPAGWSAPLISAVGNGTLSGTLAATTTLAYLGTNYVVHVSTSSGAIVLTSAGKAVTGTMLMIL